MKAIALAAFGWLAFASGCAKVAPKVIAGAEKAAVKAAPAAGQTVGKSVRKWAKRADNAMDAYDRYQQLTPSPADAPPARFPHSASSVQPVSNQSIVLNQFGTYALPNNYGGYSFYDGAGRPLGFSDWNYTRKEERYFDPFGNGL